jgi:hypothetical protein
MLIAKLETPVNKVYQGNGLQSTIVECNHMFVNITEYGIGNNTVTIEIKFGNLQLKDLNTPAGIDVENTHVISGFTPKEVFDIVFKSSTLLNLDEDLKDWTNDDSHVLDVVAEKLGLTITEKVTRDFVNPN